MKKHTANFTPPPWEFWLHFGVFVRVCVCGWWLTARCRWVRPLLRANLWRGGAHRRGSNRIRRHTMTSMWLFSNFISIFFWGGVCLSYFLFPPLALKQHVRARDEVKPVLKRRRRNTLILLGCYWTFKSTRPARPQLADLFSRWARRFLATDKAGKKTIRDDFIHFIWTLVRKQDGMLFAVGTGKKSFGIVVVDQNICLELELIL